MRQRIFLALSIFFGVYVSNSLANEKSIIDYHAHIAGIGAGDSGCFISPHLKDSFKYKIYLKAFGVTEEELMEKGDAIGFEKISKQISDSRYIAKAVILALDGYHDKDGKLDRERTQMYIPNEFVAKGVKKFPNLLFGASIHPDREDALEELDRVAAQGAVLIKWIPAIQSIQVGDEKHRAFYEKMKTLNLVLLTHTGEERSFLDADDSLGDPKRLELPLSIGVTVIAAHIATKGSLDGQPYFDRILPMFAKHPNLYADISSLTQVNKYGYLQKAVVDERLKGRLVYGSDYPLINTILVSPLYFFFDLGFSQTKQLYNLANPWDRNVMLKRMIGIDDDTFQRRLGKIK